jgi:multidrug efflux system outer membrane protein
MKTVNNGWWLVAGLNDGSGSRVAGRGWSQLVCHQSSLVTAVLLAALAAGCASTGGTIQPSTVASAPQGWRNAPAAATEAGWPDPAWWNGFGSPELVRLIASAETNNRDLAAAGHRIAQARANLQVAGSALLPSIDANGGASRSGAEGRRPSNAFQAGVGASYEIDVWGRNRAARDAASAGLASSGYARETARITVVADTATAYFQVLSLSDRLAIAQRQLDNAREFMRLLDVQYRAGAVSQLEVERQRNLIATLEAGIPPILQAREQTLDALAVLLGVPPQEVRVAGGSLSALTLPALAPGLPSSLLVRRPDIRRAESDLVAANASLEAARAAMLPRIDLSARSVIEAATVGALTGGSSLIWSLASGITAPIFDGGRLAGQRDGTEARRNELIEQYRQAILLGLRDVEDALAALNHLSSQQDAQERALAHAREAYRIAELRWRAGAQDFTTVLDAQRSLISAEASVDPIRAARFNATVDLFRALGGDWSGEPDTGSESRVAGRG